MGSWRVEKWGSGRAKGGREGGRWEMGYVRGRGRGGRLKVIGRGKEGGW